MSDSNAPEPTMEEILASIRRIISEDEPPAEAAPAAGPVHELEPLEIHTPTPPAPVVFEEPDDILDLTDLAPPPLETHGDIEVRSAPEPAAFAPIEPLEPPPPPPLTATFAKTEDDGGLMSATPAASAAFAFGRLAHTVTMPAEGRVLEDVVKELLRPLLKDWLDEHLPGIVQAKVDEEVERIARRRMG